MVLPEKNEVLFYMNADVIILGLVQGFTEFLPVSSSGHLALAQIFLGTNMPPLSYDLVLHMATALATIIFFFADIFALFVQWLSGFRSKDARKSSGWSTGWAVVSGTVITAVIGLTLKDFAEVAMMNSLMVGCGLTFTGFLLLFSSFVKTGLGRVRLTDGVIVGIAQGIAVMPGISRSGMTIVAGLMSGLSKEEAFRFSFLLSIPAILGATLIQAMELGGWRTFVAALPPYWYVGALAAFASGFFALVLLRRIVLSSKWWIFGLYCLILGISVITATYMGAW